MGFDLVLNKRGTQRVIVGVPDGVEGLIRGRIETANGDVVALHEATLAALVEAYMDVFTNPGRQAVEFRAVEDTSSDGDELAARLVQVSSDEAELRRELAEVGPTDTTAPSSISDTDLETSDNDFAGAARSFLGPGGSDSSLSVDDGPVFGEEPTHHSSPSPTGKPPQSTHEE